VGTYVITNAPGTLTSTNYCFTLTNGVLTVGPAALTVTADLQSQSYGAATPTLTASYTGWVNGDTVAVLSGAPALSVGVTCTSPVGSYAIITGPGTLASTNYSFSLVNGTLNVTPASLTITANSTGKVYGQTLTFAGTEFSTSGLQNGETIGAVTLAVSGGGAAATAPVAGSPYLITPSAATGGTFNPANYAITCVPGYLTIAGTVPVTINRPVELGDGTIQLTFTGGNAGVSYAVQGSPDLSNWTTLTSELADTNGLPAYIDVGATNHAQRFYRTVTQ
jgi:hypothetical protein